MKSPGLRILLLAVLALLIASGAVATERGLRGVSIPPDIAVEQGFDFAQSGGLFIGVGQFKDPKLAEVTYAVDDAIDMAHLFSLELGLIPPKRVRLCLTGEPKKPDSIERLKQLTDAGAERVPATKSDIYMQLDTEGARSGSQGMFVVVMATHGFSFEGKDYLVAQDTLRSRVEDTGIEVSALFDLVSQAQAPRQLMFLDACRERLARGVRAGLADPDSAMGRAFEQAMEEASGQVIFSATTQGGYAYDDDDRKNGVFSSAIMDGLRGGAGHDERGLITVHSLAEFVNTRVQDWVRIHRPEHRDATRGIGIRMDLPAQTMPLAAASEVLAKIKAYAAMLPELQKKLGMNLGKVLTPELIGEILGTLETAQKHPGSIEAVQGLIQVVQELDGSEHQQEIVKAIYVSNTSKWDQMTAPEPVGSAAVARASPPASRQLAAPKQAIAEGMVALPAGWFRMGSTPGQLERARRVAGELGVPQAEARLEREHPDHDVQLAAFSIARHEVTNAEYARFVKATNRKPPSTGDREGDQDVWQNGTYPEPLADHPVVNVSWHDANAYCKSIDARLPTEAEWEYAARGGLAELSYPWGDDYKCGPAGCPANTSRGDDYKQTAAVCEAEPESGYGLCDMVGNVREWVWDWYGEYGSDDRSNPIGPEVGKQRVVRGGSWGDYYVASRSASRSFAGPGTRRSYIGFRCAKGGGESTPGSLARSD